MRTQPGTRQTQLKRSDRTGEVRITAVAGYNTSMAISTLKNLLATQYLRRGDGIVSTPDSRRNERLFGADSTGRTKLSRAAMNLNLKNREYNPRHDTCMRAFIRFLADRADPPTAPP